LSGARVLTFDIESAGVNALKSDLGFVVCFGYKFQDEKKVHCLTATEDELRVFSDRNLLVDAAKIMEQADILVGHFASVFDRRFIQGRLLINGLPPIPPTKMRDTCMIARSVANYSSNRLAHLSEILKLKDQKYHKKGGTEWPGWWFRVMQGDMTALADMARYCKKDVLATEALYERLLPFDNAHPRIIADRTACSICGGEVQYRGITFKGQLRYRRYQCTACSRWGQEHRALKA
jgi:hypothetical protein